MKISRKKLRTLIESYLFEQANDELEDFTYTIQTGDVLSGIAQRFNTTSTDIVSATDGLNNPDRIRVGQEVVIPTMGYYTVSSGDNIGLIAQRFSTTSERIQSVNNINNPDRINMGQRLIIPMGEDNNGQAQNDGRNNISHYRNIESPELAQFLRCGEGLAGCRPALSAYRDNEGHVTIGFGHAETSRREPIPELGDTITAERAEEILQSDIEFFRQGVADSDIYRDSSDNDREARLTQNEFDALVSASFNAGIVGIGNHRNGENDNRSIGRQILDGIHTNPDSNEYDNFRDLFLNARLGDNNGLANRRAEEWDMFSQGDYDNN